VKQFIQSIDEQIESNKGKNIFLEDPELFKFISNTVNAISYIDDVDKDYENYLVNYTADKAIDEFCRINQYYSFDSKSKLELRKIYSTLFSELRNRKDNLEEISVKHYLRLKDWLQRSNHFAEYLYSNDGQNVDPVPCFEYSPSLQMAILHLDVENLMQPVLDVGCGKHGNMVVYLSDRKIRACGIDRTKFTNPDLITSDWLEYDYGVEKWGTVISNLGFSNHFNNHNLREDGNYIGYARTYMNILRSLKVGGCFHYVPNLPFMEKYLDESQFSVKTYSLDDYDFNTTVVQRLK